ncbi:MAG: hypothetical protein AB1673_02520 [Actinomycetota bacterium]
MTGYPAVPFEGIQIPAVGWVRFGDTIDEIDRRLSAHVLRRSATDKTMTRTCLFEGGFPVLLEFSSPAWWCEAIEFIGATEYPPVVGDCRLNGPTMRSAAECLVEAGYQPWGPTGPIEDLVYACRPDDDSTPTPDDSIYFHELGLVLWTDLQSEEDGVELGELRLGTVMLFRRGYLEARNAEYLAQEMPDLVVALPPLRA